MGLCCGIVGLPNVGKSTLFNALTSTSLAQAANYPFCTIEPNTGIVAVPDTRLEILAKIANSQKIIPNQLEFVDIAGLVKGASKGEGLGNQFLNNIRQVDAILHVLRCFEDEDITHVSGSVDPIRDLEVIEMELMLADLQSLEKRIPGLEKRAKSQDKEAIEHLELIKKILPLLEQGKMAKTYIPNADEKKTYDQLQLLSSKPILYVLNVLEEHAVYGNELSKKVIDYLSSKNEEYVIVSANIEAEVAILEDESSKIEFLESLGLSQTGLAKIILKAYKLLNLITFFTIGPKEARAWTVMKDSKAPKAAGAIHTDFEKGFICAETISYNDYVENNGENGAKNAGKLRQEGKDYIVKDADIFHFRFNV